MHVGNWTDPLSSNVLIRKSEGTNPDGDSTNKFESNPDDSEEDFNPDMISSPVGIEKAVSDAGEDSDLQEDRYSYYSDGVPFTESDTNIAFSQN